MRAVRSCQALATCTATDVKHGQQSIAVGVVMRDRFSMFATCLEAISAHTESPFRLILVVGGADPGTKQYLRDFERCHAGTTVVFADALLLQGEARNLALRHCSERFCVILENDTIVHQNWLMPLVDCMQDEGAAVVAPLILDFWSHRIHAAGGGFEELQSRDGVELRHQINQQGLRVATGLQGRARIDYPENHCVLINRELLPDEDLFDDVEPFDVDLGLTLRLRGLTGFLEPRSLATYMDPPPLQVRDIEAFKFRWDFNAWRERNRRFRQKWQVDYDETDKELSYRRQQLRLGLARWWPTECNVWMANAYMYLLKRSRPKMALPWVVK
jgi:GT2 family glycosyltransferase